MKSETCEYIIGQSIMKNT